MVNKHYRVDLITVKVDDAKALTQVQSQINQWITKQELVKYKTTPIGNCVLFEIVRLKGGE